MKQALYVPALLAPLVLIACGGHEVEPAQAPAAVAVRLHVVEARQIAVSHTAAAAVQALARAELATRVAGRITHIGVREGDMVNAGQLLASIDADDLIASVAQARAGLEQAQAGLDLAVVEAERAESLHAQQALTAQSLDRALAVRRQARAAVKAARQGLDGAQAMRSYGALRAPFAGMVVQRLADSGDLASPGMPLLVLERTDSVRVVASLPESTVGALQPGAPVQVECDGVQTAGVVHSIVADDEQRRTFRLQVLLPATAHLRAGRFARLNYEAGSRTLLWMPDAALVREGQLQGAYVAHDGHAVLRWLRVGGAVDAGIEVVSGLDPGDSVIVAPPAGLRDGAPIRGS